MAITTNRNRAQRHALMLLVLGVCLIASSSPTLVLGQTTQSAIVGSQTGTEVDLGPSGAATPILIGSGDLLDVEIFSTPELSGKVRVDEQGNITLPLGSSIKVGGLTLSEASSAVVQSLRANQIMTNPSVTVFVLEYATQGITVLGEVKSSGTFTLLGQHSLYDALSAAGGVTANEGSTITITHAHSASSPEIVQVTTPNYSEIQKTTMVCPGDLIFVSKADMVYVVGDVGHSGAFYIQNGQRMTVLDLISLAAGPNRTAALSHAAIVRKVGDDAQTIPFDLDKVLKNKQPNLKLQANDVIVVPRSGLKTFEQAALPQLTGSIFNAVVTALILR